MCQTFNVEFADYDLTFSEASAGFPEKMTQKLRHGCVADLVHVNLPWLHAALADGRTAYPCLAPFSQPNIRREADGTVFLQFCNICWQAEGKPLPGWYLSVDYELHPDGVGFFTTSFSASNANPEDLSSFQMQIDMDFAEDQDVTYGYWVRPKTLDGSAIQAVDSFYRNLTKKKNLTFPGSIVPLIALDLGKNGLPSRHMEWFVEQQNSVGDDPDNACSSLDWDEHGACLRYEFARSGVKADMRPYYWRNTFGFVMTQTPKVRAKAPLRIYHYIDSTRRYPTEAQIGAMAEEGADLLILHESWRADIRNGGVPYDCGRFRAMVEQCHSRGIRVATYVRGNEEALQENQAIWFDWYLKKNYDGLYVDYGGPIHYLERGDKYPGGRFAFRRHYHVIKALRERCVGEDGVMILHTGPFFSGAVLASLIDGYTSGEGENGIMLSSRRENAYFSESTIAPGTLWTAAFPAYKSKKVLPFMANIGQYPNVTLGVQLASSSLAHPLEPGNVTFARPLWRLYGLMKDERQLAFSNDLCDPAFICDGEDTGLSCFTMQDGSSLCLLSNFSASERICSANIPFPIMNGQICYVLHVSEKGCVICRYDDPARFTASLDASGICGFLICTDSEKWRARLSQFVQPYPSERPAEKQYKQSVLLMKALRFEPDAAKTAYLRIRVPAFDSAWEKELWNDLFDSVYQMFISSDVQPRHAIGYVSKLGFTETRPAVETSLWPAESSPWIALHTLLPKGRTLIELCALRGQKPYYSMIQAELALQPGKNVRRLEFVGELDEDRSRLTFAVELL